MSQEVIERSSSIDSVVSSLMYVAVLRPLLSMLMFQATGEGTHFLIPWLQRAILYDVRIKPRVRAVFASMFAGVDK
jgi:regulator of protease activity HflC (stomatin/prohibitin superfamily)